MSETNNVLTLDSPELSLADYRTLRSGGEVARPAEVVTPSTTETANANEVETAVEQEPTGKTETKQDKPSKGDKDGLNFRFSELTGKIKTLEAQLAATKPAAETKPAAAETKPAGATDPEPDPAKFTDYTEWQKAYIKWELKQADATRAAESTKQARQIEAAKAAETWQSRVSEAAKSNADFETVALNPELSISTVMGDAIRDSEIGTDVLYHLGKNPDEAARISKLSPLAQVRELGKLEARIAKTAAAEPAETQTTKPVAVSKAPAPVKPVSAAASSTTKSVDSMSLSEYRALRESGKLR